MKKESEGGGGEPLCQFNYSEKLMIIGWLNMMRKA